MRRFFRRRNPDRFRLDTGRVVDGHEFVIASYHAEGGRGWLGTKRVSIQFVKLAEFVSLEDWVARHGT